MAIPKKTGGRTRVSRKSPPEASVDLEKSADRFRLLSDKSRLKILLLLSDGEMSLTDIVQAMGKAVQLTSGKIRLLTLQGLLEKRRDGHLMFYRVAEQWRPALVLVKMLAELE